MTNITLKARLQAYSRAPIYADYIRNILGEQGLPQNTDGTSLKPNTSYIWQGNHWEEMDFGDITELTDRIMDVEDKSTLNSIQLKQIDVTSPKAGVIAFTNSEGTTTNIDLLPNTFVDGTTIYINEDNQISLLHPWDNATITLNNDSGKMQVSGIVINNKIVTGDELNTKFEQLNSDISYIQSYLSNGGVGTSLPPVKFPQFDGTYTGSLTSAEENYSAWVYVQDFLSEYAVKELNKILEDQGQQETITPDTIPNNVRVQDLITGFLWVYSRDNIEDAQGSETAGTIMGQWLNNGKDLIVSATNDGIIGAVTGAEWVDNNQNIVPSTTTYEDKWDEYTSYLKGTINAEISPTGQVSPTFTLNGLAERLKDLDRTKVERLNNTENKFDIAYVQPKNTNFITDANRAATASINIVDRAATKEDYALSLVKRTEDGIIKSSMPQVLEDVVNIEWFNTQAISNEDFEKIINKINVPAILEGDWINNSGDPTNELMEVKL